LHDFLRRLPGFAQVAWLRSEQAQFEKRFVAVLKAGGRCGVFAGDMLFCFWSADPVLLQFAVECGLADTQQTGGQ
jgi:hypothetical protein